MPRPQSQLLPLGKKVIDLSADYRLNDPAEYAQWYGLEHADPAARKDAVYGLPELFRDEIRTASLVANPGCYPTSAILALAPLLRSRRDRSRRASSSTRKSGVCGGGREPKPHFHFPECNESISAYNVGRHRHTPEIDQMLTDAAGKSVEVIFTPHLVPMDRGILSTTLRRSRPATFDRRALLSAAPRFLRRRAVRPRGRPSCRPRRTSRGTNFCDITARVVRGRVVVDQLHRQPDQGRLRRGGAELQPDVRLSGNHGVIVVDRSSISCDWQTQFDLADLHIAA